MTAKAAAAATPRSGQNSKDIKTSAAGPATAGVQKNVNQKKTTSSIVTPVQEPGPSAAKVASSSSASSNTTTLKNANNAGGAAGVSNSSGSNAGAHSGSALRKNKKPVPAP